MTRFASAARAAVLLMMVAGCGFPRGAGFEREVLLGTVEADGQITRDFAVEPVTRADLSRYADWPRTGPGAMRWISRTCGLFSAWSTPPASASRPSTVKSWSGIG